MKTRAALYAQTVRNPILVITIGVLFAVQQAGILPFSRTWPLIIIMIGLMKLIERLLTPHPPYPPAPYANPGAPPR
jgi:hypothetical protein